MYNGKKELFVSLQWFCEIQYISLYFKRGESIIDINIGLLFGIVQNFSIMFFFLIWKVRCDIFFIIKVYCLFWFKCKGFFGNIYVIVLILVNEVWICCGWGSKEI